VAASQLLSSYDGSSRGTCNRRTKFGKDSIDIKQSAILIFISICLAGLTTTNKKEKHSSHVGSTLKENIRVNYKD